MVTPLTELENCSRNADLQTCCLGFMWNDRECLLVKRLQRNAPIVNLYTE